MPRNDSRKAFEGPITWEARRGTVWQHRGCSTPGCTAGAHWLIAETVEMPNRRARFACTPCLQKKYSHLERRLWYAPEEPA